MAGTQISFSHFSVECQKIKQRENIQEKQHLCHHRVLKQTLSEVQSGFGPNAHHPKRNPGSGLKYTEIAFKGRCTSGDMDNNQNTENSS